MEAQLIFVQQPQPTASDIIKVVNDQLKEEEHFEQISKRLSLRGESVRKIILKIEKMYNR